MGSKVSRRASLPRYLSSDQTAEMLAAQRDGSTSAVEAFQRLQEMRGLAAAAVIPEAIARVRSLLQRNPTLKLVAAVHRLDSMRRASVAGEDGFGSDAMMELLAGLAASVPGFDVSDRSVDPLLITEVDELLNLVANAMQTLHVNRLMESSYSPDAAMLDLFRAERLFDRLAGFDTPLRRVVKRVFAAYELSPSTRFDFELNDAVRFAEFYGRGLEERAASLPPLDLQHYEGVASIGAEALLLASPVERPETNIVWAERLGMELEAFESLLLALSTELGTAHVVDGESDNPTRNRPILRAPDGRWVWCRPIDFLHGALGWAQALVASDDARQSRFDRARQRVAERMPAELLEEVFGDVAHSNVAYTEEGAVVEVDTLVVLPDLVIIVEAKGGRFSEAGRRGAPERIRRHARDLIVRGADQLTRCRDAIRNGLAFHAASGAEIDLVGTEDAISIVVTLDRVDPFNAHLGFSRSNALDDRAWVMTLVDLLVLAEVLPDPESFVGYCIRRMEMQRSGSTVVWSEVDALGAWCRDRLTRLTRVEAKRGKELSFLGTTSAAMNDYFSILALQEHGVDPAAIESWRADSATMGARPTTGVPEPVQRALTVLRAGGGRGWLPKVRDVFGVEPARWQAFDRLLDVAAGRRGSTKATRRGLALARKGLCLDGLRVRISTLGELDDDYLNVEP